MNNYYHSENNITEPILTVGTTEARSIITTVAFSPENRWIAIGWNTGCVDVKPIYSQPNRRFYLSFYRETGNILSISFSPDIEYLAIVQQSNHRKVVHIWNIGTNKHIREFEIPEAKRVYYTPDGQYLVIIGKHQILLLDPDPRTFQILKQTRFPPDQEILDVGFQTEIKRVLVTTERTVTDRNLWILEIRDGNPELVVDTIRRLNNDPERDIDYRDLNYLNFRRFLIETVSNNGNLRCIEHATRYIKNRVFALSFDGQLLGYFMNRHKIEIYSYNEVKGLFERSKCIHNPIEYTEYLMKGMCFSPNSDLLASYSEQKVRIWRIVNPGRLVKSANKKR